MSGYGISIAGHCTIRIKSLCLIKIAYQTQLTFMADAILNSKLNTAEKLGIKLNVKANIPNVLAMSDVELCSVLGNMLDNAVEACDSLPKACNGGT